MPEIYNLLLYPDLKESKFSGTVDIVLEVTSSVNYIVLHSKNLTISHTTFSPEATNEVNLVKNAFSYLKNEFWVVELTESVPDGKYNLKLDFSGSLIGMVGFYRSNYQDVNSGQNRLV